MPLADAKITLSLSNLTKSLTSALRESGHPHVTVLNTDQILPDAKSSDFNLFISISNQERRIIGDPPWMISDMIDDDDDSYPNRRQILRNMILSEHDYFLEK